MLGSALDSAGEPELALEALSEAAKLSNGNSKVLSMRGYVLAELGRVDAARDVLRELEARGRERYVPPYATRAGAGGPWRSGGGVCGARAGVRRA